jgi:PAS domain S-box-containing protein
LELLLDAISEYAICMLDPNGFVTTWNVGAERIKGYASVEIIGQHFSRFFTAEDQALGVPQALLETARTEGRYESEGWRVRKNGSRFWCNAVVHRIVDEHGQVVGFAKIIRDITERMEAQEALRHSERRFRMLVEGVVDYALYMLDPSGVVVNWNRGAEYLKGYTAEEIVGQHFSKFYTKEDRAAGMPARVLDTAARDGRFEGEGWRVRKDGSRFWALVVVDAIRNDETGSLEGFVKITRDITERRSAQEALRESERQFRLLVAGVTDYALFMLDPNGIVTSWNAGAARIKGYTANEIIGQHFSRFYPERDRAAGMPLKALYTAVQEGRFEAEGWRVRKDGTMFWANVVIDPIRDEKGDLIGFAKITRDITERRDAQKALQQAEEQRTRSQKMDALGQLTGGVAHDFNNLLTVVRGHTELIRGRIAAAPGLARSIEAIETAIARGETLTRQLLAFARRQPANPRVILLGERVEGLRAMLGGALEPGVSLVATIGSEVWPVKVDPNELELALVNIVLNSRDAIPATGAIAVVAENVVLTGDQTLGGLAGEFVALTISDTGAGIPPDVLPKVFDPFFTTKPAEKGSGLGLSQVYGFAHQSGGTVTIDSEIGTGTMITLYLPRGLDDPQAVDEHAHVGTTPGGRVLLVEDNPEVADVSRSMLEELAYTVRTAGDAEAALQALEEESFDLVMSDIVMAGAMDGLALGRAIRARYPGLAVMLVSGYSRASNDAVDEFVVMRKPYKLSELSRVTTRVIAEAQQPADSNVIRLRDARPQGSQR